MSSTLRWTLGVIVAIMVLGIPVIYFRWEYTHSKRLRVVKEGVLYRGGEMTADGFTDAVNHLQIKTIINLQDEYSDPDLPRGYFGGGSVKESELCRSLCVKYVYIAPDLLPRREVPARRPLAIDRFLAIMDDPANFPVLIHCRAGLHRTGVMTAVFRMEYCGWSWREAVDELKANGFGEWPCHAANDYITQYILNYQKGLRKTEALAHRQ